MTAGTLKRFLTPMMLGSLVLMAAGCDDPLEPEEHPEAGGVVILAAGTQTVLARAVGRGADFDNEVVVPLGGALEVDIRFLSEDDPTNLAAAFAPDEDEGQSLRVTIADEAIASFDSHGDHGDFGGVAAGSTTAVIELMHGGHSDFDTGDLTIEVQ